MGIPKFFRFISERWPLISQLIDGNQIPEFDNLYLDMNSILHTCTHSNDDTLSRMTEDQMYAAIFSYIEHLFEIIKPKETFYMAIDGVAPRAKMNQQRARRFRTAYEAEENLKKAINQGLEIPKEDPFDSNSITPGTEFMSKLTDNLKYFIHKKISEDSRWSNIKIILSGHEVPGEGEHKIMNFIRSVKSQPDFNVNSRHCIYGLDADLIMLGLVSHEPHFSLLREEVTFGPRSQKKSNDLNDQKFFLLHLSLLREYLSLEFQDLDNQLNFEYNFEKVLDDFILIMYVIGNDFLPNLPDLFINKGAFPLLIETFKQSLKQSDGYINEGGKINFKRLNFWFNSLSEFELENFEKQDVDVDWFNKRLEDISITGEKKRERTGKLLLLKDQKKLVGVIKPWLLEINSHPINKLIEQESKNELPSLQLPTDEVEKHLDFVKKFALDTGILIIHSKSANTYEARLDIDGISPYESEDENNNRINDLRKTIKKYQSANLFETDELMKDSKDIYDSKFLDWKDKYYKEKLNFSIHDKEKMIDLTQHYIEGLQWVLYYYYKGCPSWNWFFRYHYAPRISDISIGLNAFIENNQFEIKFDQSTPFKPFEQLMAVLPARSKQLMPVVYRKLMTDPQSPIIDFYPAEVDIDLNGKTASWEAVVLLSFVDEKKLLDVLKPVELQLTPEEKRRNSFGNEIQFIFNPQIDQVYQSPLPGFFHDLEHDQCYEEKFEVTPARPDFAFDLLEGAKTGKDLLAGFPTLRTIEFDSELSLHEVKVFQNPSRSESMILSLKNIWDDLSTNQFSHKFINKVVYSRWPFLRESRVVKVVDEETVYESVKSGNVKKIVSSPISPEELKDFKSLSRSISQSYEKTKGIKLGDVNALVHVQPVTGLIRNQKGAYVKTFSKEIEVYPIQLIVEEVINEDERYATRPPIPIEEEFPLQSQVVFLGAFAYGAPATIAGYTDNQKVNIKVNKIQATAEPNIGKRRLEVENKEIKYLPSFQVSKLLKLNPLFLSQITSGFMLEDGNKKVNIGLELKFEARRQKVLGYTQKYGKVWEFSPLAIQLIRNYQNKFPSLFNNLIRHSSNTRNMPKVKEVSSEEEIQEVRKFLKEAKLQLITVSLESESLTRFSFNAIESYIEHYIAQPPPLSNKDIKGVPKEAILDPSESYQLLSTQKFELGDRVIYVQDSGKVPKLSKGTVVSIISIGNKNSLGVIFDYPILSGNNFNGKLNTNRGLSIDSSLVLNLTNKQLVYHSKASKNQKPISAQERLARQQQIEEAKNKKKELEKQNNAKKSNELLTLLKQNKDAANKAQASDELNKDNDEVFRNHDAIKQIYGQIYSNVMSEGSQSFHAPPPPPGPGMVIPPHLYGGVPPVNGFAYPQGAYQQVPPVAPASEEAKEANGDAKPRGTSNRGRGGSRGRGGRGGSRSGRGNNTRGRGRGKSSNGTKDE